MNYPNMDYCKFSNTLAALRQCEPEMFTVCDDLEEDQARIKILSICERWAEELENCE